MFAKLILVAVFLAFAKAQENNQICPCDTEQDIKDNKDYWGFLKQLSVDVSDEMKEIYSISPGTLYQFDCSHCDEKLRKKRRIEEPELPEEVKEEGLKEGAKDESVKDEGAKEESVKEEGVKEESVKEESAKVETGADAAEEVDREKRYIKFHDTRCPKGYFRMHRFCVPEHEIDDISDWYQN